MIFLSTSIEQEQKKNFKQQLKVNKTLVSYQYKNLDVVLDFRIHITFIFKYWLYDYVYNMSSEMRILFIK